MPITVWIWSTGAPTKHCAEALRDALKEQGAEVAAEMDAPTANLGLVLFEAPDEQVLDCVRRANLSRRQRLIAISTSPAGCTPETAWALLRAGASDVWTDCVECSDGPLCRFLNVACLGSQPWLIGTPGSQSSSNAVSAKPPLLTDFPQN